MNVRSPYPTLLVVWWFVLRESGHSFLRAYLKIWLSLKLPIDSTLQILYYISVSPYIKVYSDAP
ncbi:hypothetical protein hrd7_33990 (plasmid) [Leptolinea sp. HRD-7]|jgi:hypothetical protein|nr:hypothetical protein hrd7_33990 [Leptolinea sp. HRD-7]